MADIKKPEWLNNTFLENLLNEDLHEDEGKIEITDFDVALGVPKGTNYLSTILRINIEFVFINASTSEPGSISLIAKVPLEDEALADINNSGIIEREIEVYNEILPKLNKIITDHGGTAVSPKFYKCDVKNVLILEDLTPSGYTLLDRRKQLDFNHTELTIKNLAMYHAASITLHEQEPKLVERVGRFLIFHENMEDRYKNMFDSVLGASHLENLCLEIENWPESKKLAEPLRKLVPNVWRHYLRGMDPYKNELMALNHGDPWVNNVLYKYDQNGNPVDLNFVDFQMARFTCPTMDLLYFLYTSTKYDVMKTRFQELTDIYFHNLNDCLEKFGSRKRLERDNFESSIKVREIFCLIHCINSLPLVLGDCNETDDRFMACQKSQRYREIFAKYLEDFSRKPWFNDFEMENTINT